MKTESKTELSEAEQTPSRRILGAGRGEMILPSWEEWEAMDEEIAREMNEGPLIPGETLEETMRWLPQAMEKLKADLDANPEGKLDLRAKLRNLNSGTP